MPRTLHRQGAKSNGVFLCVILSRAHARSFSFFSFLTLLSLLSLFVILGSSVGRVSGTSVGSSNGSSNEKQCTYPLTFP